MRSEPDPLYNRLFELITNDDDARACEDIPESSCTEQPRNFVLILLGNLLTKLGDELASAKLVFPWVLGLLGAPLVLVSLCVPIRESGVLMPQLVVAAKVRLFQRRKWVWAFGSLLTSASLFGCALTLFLAPAPRSAQLLIMGCLLVFSVSRGICSVAAKDVMGKTVAKGRRGTLTGLATSVSGFFTLLVALGLGQSNGLKSSETLLALVFALAGVCWLISAVLQVSVREQAGATAGGRNGAKLALQELVHSFKNKDFAAFVATRTLLLSVSLTTPALVVLAQQYLHQTNLLGFLMLTSGLANGLSGYVWGRLSDWASHRIMAIAAALNAGLIGLGLLLINLVEKGGPTLVLLMTWFFLASVALAGVRVGRKTHLIDISNAQNRASHVAVSNTVIGVLILLMGSALSWLAGGAVIHLLCLYALLSVLACVMALRLKHAQR